MAGRYELREKSNPTNFITWVSAANEGDARAALIRMGQVARGEEDEAIYELVCYHATTGAAQTPVDW